MSGRIRVMVVDDSAYNRRVISEMLSKSERIEVVARARDGEDALKKLYEVRPDLITLDLEMPRMDGFTFLRLVMQSQPLPVIVVSSRTEDRAIFRALELGAADFVVKPTVRVSEAIQRIEQELLWKIESSAEVRMDHIVQFEGGELPEPTPVSPEPAEQELAPPDCVVVASSTGGPAAIQYLLLHLPKAFQTPMAIAQHMPAGFTRPFAERLARRTGRDVREAADGDHLKKGTVLIAPGGAHLQLERAPRCAIARIVGPADSDRFVPSADHLMRSAAEAFGSSIQGIVLTGMGNDGLKGARAIREAGGTIIAEAEETAIVYGMPREVAEAGLTDRVLPLSLIPKLLAGEAKRRTQKG